MSLSALVKKDVVFSFLREHAAGDWQRDRAGALSFYGGQEVPPLYRCSSPWNSASNGYCPPGCPSLHPPGHLFQGLHNSQGILVSSLVLLAEEIWNVPADIMSCLNRIQWLLHCCTLSSKRKNSGKPPGPSTPSTSWTKMAILRKILRFSHFQQVNYQVSVLGFLLEHCTSLLDAF